MIELSSTTTLIQLCILFLNAILAIIYFVPILIVSRFHNVHNLLTANLSCAILFCTLAWLVSFTLREFLPNIYKVQVSCALILYFQAMATIQVPLAALQGSFHRLLSIVYYRNYFNTKNFTFVTFLIIQWTIGFLITIPHGFPQDVSSSFTYSFICTFVHF